MVQDTFVIAFKKANDLRGETLLAYLKKIAIHECFRKRKRQAQQQAMITFSLDDDTVDMPDPNEDFLPEAAIQNKEMQKELMQIINALSKNQREMTYLYYYFNFNSEEIARLYHCTSAHVRVTLQRARQAIRNKLEGRGNRIFGKTAAMAMVALGLLILMEEQLFVATYIPTVPVCIVGTASGTTAVATTATTVTSAAVIKGCLIAACVITVGIIATNLYIAINESAPYTPYVINHETTTPTTYHTTAIPVQPPITDATPQLPAPTQAPTPPTQPPTLTSPPTTDPPPTPPPTTLPPPTPPPTTVPPTTMAVTEPPPPPPQDRTQAILARLATATTQADVAHIIAYYGFADRAEMETHSGITFQFYVLDDGSGDILIGTGISEDGTHWYMRFGLFASGQAPTDVMERLLFMEYL